MAMAQVQSANIVGFDNSYTGIGGNNFVSGDFVSIGYNTMDINQIQIPGAEWEGVTFTIWEGLPTVRAGSEFTYYDAAVDPEEEAVTSYWGDEEYKQKRNNAESAVRELVSDAKKYMQMSESECKRIFTKIYEQNYKTNAEMPKDKDGNKIYNLAI